MSYSHLLLVLFTASLVGCLNDQYKGTPQTVANIKAVLKHSLELKCEYEGSDGEFIEWFKDDKPISAEKAGHYVVKQTEKESILIIKIFVKDDATVKKWHVTTRKTGEDARPKRCEFGQIEIKPSPQAIHTNREKEVFDSGHESVRRNEGEQLHLKCVISPKSETPMNVKWEFSKDEATYTDLPDEVVVENNEVRIDSVKKVHRGFYRCTLNDVSYSVLLRVKDRLAALWPFLGIVGVVLVLVIIILIFEKRQKSNKKPVAGDDDDQDQANDPLVRTTTTKGSDSDTKKRAVKT